MSDELDKYEFFYAPEYDSLPFEAYNFDTESGYVTFNADYYGQMDSSMKYYEGSGNNEWWGSKGTIDDYVEYNQNEGNSFMEGDSLTEPSFNDSAQAWYLGLAGVIAPIGIYYLCKGLWGKIKHKGRNAINYTEMGVGGSLGGVSAAYMGTNLAYYYDSFYNPAKYTSSTGMPAEMVRLQAAKGLNLSFGSLAIGAGITSIISGVNDIINYYKERKKTGEKDYWRWGMFIGKTVGGFCSIAGGVLSIRAGLSDWYSYEKVGELGMYIIDAKDAATINANIFEKSIDVDLGSVWGGVFYSFLGLAITGITCLAGYIRNKRRRNKGKTEKPINSDGTYNE